jgi:hypothetical protein
MVADRGSFDNTWRRHIEAHREASHPLEPPEVSSLIGEDEGSDGTNPK